MPVFNMPEPAMTYVGPDGEIGYYTESQVQALVDRINELEADLLPLQIFMDSVFGEFPEHGDVDGFTLQDIAESCGLLVPEKRSEACSENCTCVTYVDSAGFTKDWTCYRVQPVMKRARRALLKEQT